METIITESSESIFMINFLKETKRPEQQFNVLYKADPTFHIYEIPKKYFNKFIAHVDKTKGKNLEADLEKIKNENYNF